MQSFSSRLSQLSIEQKDYYADINASFLKDSKTNDVAAVTNASAVQQSLVSIIGTRRGERVFDPSYGCDIHASLFENMNDASMVAIEKAIGDAVRNHEPRAKLQSVDVTPVYDENMYIVTVQYKIITDLNYIRTLKMELANG